MPQVGSRKLDLDQFDLVVDQHADPLDLDQFLDALDRFVERRLKHRNQTALIDAPAVDLSITTTKCRH